MVELFENNGIKDLKWTYRIRNKINLKRILNGEFKKKNLFI